MAKTISDKLKAFLDAANKDESIMKKLNETHTAEDVIAVAAENGFPLEKEDFIIITTSPATEITDDDLENVSGGSWHNFKWGGDLPVYRCSNPNCAMEFMINIGFCPACNSTLEPADQNNGKKQSDQRFIWGNTAPVPASSPEKK